MCGLFLQICILVIYVYHYFENNILNLNYKKYCLCVTFQSATSY